MRYVTNGFFSLLLVAVALSSGCSHDPAQQQLDAAQQGVQKALETWKQGAKAENLKSGTPPIEFHDDDWQQAARLLDYQVVQTYLDPDGSPRCAVTLTVQRPRQQPEQLRVTYQVVEKGAIVIARDPFS